MDTKTKAWTEMTTEEQLTKALSEVERLQRILNAHEEHEEEDKQMYKSMGANDILSKFASPRLFDAIEDEDKDTVLKIMKGFMRKMHIKAYGHNRGDKFVIHSYEDQYDFSSNLCWCLNEKTKEVEVVYRGYRSTNSKYDWSPIVKEIPAIVEVD